MFNLCSLLGFISLTSGSAVVINSFGDSGNITFPANQSKEYENNMNLEWRIYAPKDAHKILIQILKFDIHRVRGYPCFDYLQIEEMDANFRLFKGCGNLGLRNYTVSGNSFKVTFISDNVHTATGFQIYWHVISFKGTSSNEHTSRKISYKTKATTIAISTQISKHDNPVSNSSSSVLTSSLLAHLQNSKYHDKGSTKTENRTNRKYKLSTIRKRKRTFKRSTTTNTFSVMYDKKTTTDNTVKTLEYELKTMTLLKTTFSKIRNVGNRNPSHTMTFSPEFNETKNIPNVTIPKQHHTTEIATKIRATKNTKHKTDKDNANVQTESVNLNISQFHEGLQKEREALESELRISTVNTATRLLTRLSSSRVHSCSNTEPMETKYTKIILSSIIGILFLGLLIVSGIAIVQWRRSFGRERLLTYARNMKVVSSHQYSTVSLPANKQIHLDKMDQSHKNVNIQCFNDGAMTGKYVDFKRQNNTFSSQDYSTKSGTDGSLSSDDENELEQRHIYLSILSDKMSNDYSYIYDCMNHSSN